MQSISTISKTNDLEAIRQIVDAGHGEIVLTQTGALVPNGLLNNEKVSRLTGAGFKIAQISGSYTTIN